MEQLRTFAEVAGEFTKQGINILAISPDSPEEAPRANKWAKDKAGFPFKLISAADLAAFHAYRAYDDFEKFPMHAIALVDGRQRLRWLDVTYKPFMDAKFLIQESKRLLALPELDTVVTR
jgi:peroxiredoxin